jgi:hypothetical protein
MPPTTDVIKVDIDLIKVDALVLQKNTARTVGGLKKEDFLLFEDADVRALLLDCLDISKAS